MSTDAPRRKLRLPLDRVIGELLAMPGATGQELRAARGGRDLIRSLLHLEGGHDLTIADILDTPQEVFDAAYEIVNGGRGAAAMRMATEEIDGDVFGALSAHLLERTPAEPDPSVAPEFV